MKRNASGVWQFADGRPFKMVFLGQTDVEPSQNRAAAMVVECWKEFGLDVSLQVTASFTDYQDMGDFDGMFYWNIETWGGHPDLSYFLDHFHSNQYAPNGQRQPGRNKIRLKDPRIDKIIETSQSRNMDVPSAVELGQEFCKIWTDEMYEISVCAYDVFTAMDEYYWTGYPDVNNPYTDPVPNWTNSRYMFLKLKGTGK